MTDSVILVNSQNRTVGRAEKLSAHTEGRLHRAFSICLIDPAGRLLLQRRHPKKYHSGGLWANSCCGHPRPGERTLAAAQRRLGEELGATARLQFGFLTRYHAAFPNGLTESEIVHVYFGRVPEALALNPVEVSAVRLMALPELRRDLRTHPEAYAVWLRHYVINHASLIREGIDRLLRPGRKVRGGAKRPKFVAQDRRARSRR